MIVAPLTVSPNAPLGLIIALLQNGPALGSNITLSTIPPAESIVAPPNVPPSGLTVGAPWFAPRSSFDGFLVTSFPVSMPGLEAQSFCSNVTPPPPIFIASLANVDWPFRLIINPQLYIADSRFLLPPTEVPHSIVLPTPDLSVFAYLTLIRRQYFQWGSVSKPLAHLCPSRLPDIMVIATVLDGKDNTPVEFCPAGRPPDIVLLATARRGMAIAPIAICLGRPPDTAIATARNDGKTTASIGFCPGRPPNLYSAWSNAFYAPLRRFLQGTTTHNGRDGSPVEISPGRPPDVQMIAADALCTDWPPDLVAAIAPACCVDSGNHCNGKYESLVEISCLNRPPDVCIDNPCSGMDRCPVDWCLVETCLGRPPNVFIATALTSWVLERVRLRNGQTTTPIGICPEPTSDMAIALIHDGADSTPIEICLGRPPDMVATDTLAISFDDPFGLELWKCDFRSCSICSISILGLDFYQWCILRTPPRHHKLAIDDVIAYANGSVVAQGMPALTFANLATRIHHKPIKCIATTLHLPFATFIFRQLDFCILDIAVSPILAMGECVNAQIPSTGLPVVCLGLLFGHPFGARRPTVTRPSFLFGSLCGSLLALMCTGMLFAAPRHELTLLLFQHRLPYDC